MVFPMGSNCDPSLLADLFVLLRMGLYTFQGGCSDAIPLCFYMLRLCCPYLLLISPVLDHTRVAGY